MSFIHPGNRVIRKVDNTYDAGISWERQVSFVHINLEISKLPFRQQQVNPFTLFTSSFSSSDSCNTFDTIETSTMILSVSTSNWKICRSVNWTNHYEIKHNKPFELKKPRDTSAFLHLTQRLNLLLLLEDHGLLCELLTLVTRIVVLIRQLKIGWIEGSISNFWAEDSPPPDASKFEFEAREVIGDGVDNLLEIV